MYYFCCTKAIFNVVQEAFLSGDRGNIASVVYPLEVGELGKKTPDSYLLPSNYKRYRTSSQRTSHYYRSIRSLRQVAATYNSSNSTSPSVYLCVLVMWMLILSIRNLQPKDGELGQYVHTIKEMECWKGEKKRKKTSEVMKYQNHWHLALSFICNK